MDIDITKLKSGYESSIPVDISYEFSKEQLEQTELLELKNVKIEGNLSEKMDEYYLSAEITGTMVLPCAVTLEPVNYEFETNIDDFLSNLYEENQKNLKKEGNTIDIFPIIWENILMEIPMRVVSPKAASIKTEGEGWRLITDDEEEQPNSSFDKLNDLLK